MPTSSPVNSPAVMDTPAGSLPKDALPQDLPFVRRGMKCASDGADNHTTAEAVVLNRVGRVISDMAAARAVGDFELRQHALDCAHLMEEAYGRFQATGNVHDREDALLWMSRRDEALRSLSPAWKAAREAEIQQAIGQGCFFMEQGDAARARIGGRG